ncbi:MAG: DUF4920 domain-containing protein [Proteobacteria bacterium]|nr:DUF4920 domain-containing protein [Pseudomonadota bacterium]
MRILIAAAVWLAVSLSHDAFALEGKTYGKGVTLEKPTPVSEIMANPERFVGKTVLIQGNVVGVCSHRGCWMDIASDVPFQKIQVKVADGEIVFPLDAKGKKAMAEGILEKLEYSREQIVRWRRHQAERRGETFDPSTVKGGETFYQIRGTGAVIQD